jgi:RNA-directed DNA polymerase
MTPRAQGLDFFGQTVRQQGRPNGQPAKLQRTPSKASVPAITATIKALCRRAAGATPAQRSETLHPRLRGGATYHRHSLCRATCAPLDSFVWRRLSRGATLRHPNTTGRWSTERYFPHQPGTSWRFTDPTTGQQLLRRQAAVKPQRQMKGKSEANPFDPHWATSLQERARRWAVQTTSALRAKFLQQQTGRCPLCRQLIQGAAPVALHHRDGVHQNNRRANLVLLHPNCHRQVHYAPDSTTTMPRPSRGVGHACAECRETGSLRSEGAGWA